MIVAARAGAVAGSYPGPGLKPIRDRRLVAAPEFRHVSRASILDGHGGHQRVVGLDDAPVPRRMCSLRRRSLVTKSHSYQRSRPSWRGWKRVRPCRLRLLSITFNSPGRSRATCCVSTATSLRRSSAAIPARSCLRSRRNPRAVAPRPWRDELERHPVLASRLINATADVQSLRDIATHYLTATAIASLPGVMSILLALLGEQIGYRPEMGGRPVPDAMPVRGYQLEQVSTGALVDLLTHVEMAFSEWRSDFVALLNLRADDEGVSGTTLSSIDPHSPATRLRHRRDSPLARVPDEARQVLSARRRPHDRRVDRPHQRLRGLNRSQVQRDNGIRGIP